MPYFTRRYRLVVLSGLVGVIALVLVGRWLNATKRGGQGPAEPFRIAGNLYYVGASDASAFLVTGPEGQILLDGGYPTTASMIMASIAKLGFNIKDVKVMRVDHRFRTETLSASGRSHSPLISPRATRADALHGRSRFMTVTAC